MSLADYNNNPGNLRPPKGVKYEGQIDVDANGFAVFENKDYGRKALVNDIETKIKKGLATPESFIDRYTPASDENPEDGRINYKIFLADQLGMKSTADKFPENSAQKIADAIAHFESGTQPSSENVAPEVTVGQPANFDVPKLPSSNTESNPRKTEINPIVGGVIGGVNGALAGTAAAYKKAQYDALSKAYEAINGGLKRGTDALDDSPGAKWGAKTGYGKGSGTVQDASSAYQRAVGKGKITGRMDKLWGVPQAGESPELAQRLIDRAQNVQPATQNASKLSKAASYIGNLGALPVKGAMMGAVGGLGAVDAYNRHRAGENIDAAISGLGAAASLAAPYVASAGALPAASIAAPLYLIASDRIKRLQEHPEEIQLQEDEYDAMGNRQR